MLINHQTFYRKFGVRQINQLAAPTTAALQFLELPMESVWHYVNYDGSVTGPQNDEYLLRNVKHNIPVFHVENLLSSVGNPRPIPGTFNAVIKAYHQTHRHTHWLKQVSMAVKDRATPIVYNYALLPKAVRYQQSVYSNYYRWRNIFTTVIKTAAECAQQTGRHQFIFLESPKLIPSIMQLDDAREGLTQTLLKYFNDTNACVLLDLWKWLKEPVTESESAFASIPAEQLHLFDLVFQEAGQWFTLNLGMLFSWKKPLDKDEEDYQSRMADQSKQKADMEQLAKRLLRMYMSVMELRTITAKLDASQPVPEVTIKKPPVETAEVDDDDEVDVESEEDPSLDDIEQTIQDAEVLLEDTKPMAPTANIEDLDDDDFDALLRAEDEQLDADLMQLHDIASKQDEQPSVSAGEIQQLLESVENTDLAAPIAKACAKLANDGAISAAEYNRFVRLSESYKNIVSPDGLTSLEEFTKIPPEKLALPEAPKVPDSESVVDKSMLKSTLLEFDEKYIGEVLDKDNANSVLSLQNAAVAVTNYKVTEHEDILGAHQEFVVKLVPVVGVPSTLRFKVPKINEDGTFKSNGVTYRLRKQRGDLPIRKVAPNKVALTSYYGKCFVTRSRTNATSYNHWLQTQLTAQAIDPDNSHITEAMMDNVFDRTLKAPRCYSAISMNFKSFFCQTFEFCFDHAEVAKTWEANILKEVERNGSILVARGSTSYLYVDKFGALFEYVNKQSTPRGSLEEFLGINPADAPVEYASVGVFGKDIPLGFVLGMEMGLQALIQALGARYRVVPAGQRIGLQPNEYALSFSDESWVFNREQHLATMILSGFNEYHKSLKLFSVYSFNKRGVYQNLLETSGLGVRYVREIALMYQMFIDPITRDLLVEMKEPTSFKGLLVRAAQMLLTDSHPDELDPAMMRIKGYERISGAIYTELIQSLRAHNAKLGKSNAQIELNPYAVWKRIMEDPSKTQVQEINPIKQVKESEAVTFAGTGGRNKRSMTKNTRVYHPNDMGTISESTVDSSDVGINIHTSANPQFTSLRGMSRPFDMNRDGPTSLLSTSAMLAPSSDRDDPKRVNFIAIQQEHTVACEGYHQATVCTGYDAVLAHRTTDLFAFTAKKPGVVRQVEERGIIVDYDDGDAQGFELGRRFGSAAGLTIAHTVVTPLKEGERFAVGDAICYNTGFFEPDFFDPKRLALKNAMDVKTVLWESAGTHEDSSSISAKTAQKLTTSIAKVKLVVLRFDQAVSNLLKVGTVVDADSVLCIIEDAVTANNKLFDERSIETLKALSAQTPKANVKGTIERIEVFYHGDKEDMSESLVELCNYGDKDLRKRAGAVGKNPFTGKVDGGFRIEGDPLPVDHVAIRFSITSHADSGVGDKGVFANQMKTVFGDVMEGQMTTEAGEEIDAIFGAKSIEGRIVNSPIHIGTTATLVKAIQKGFIDIYRGRKQ